MFIDFLELYKLEELNKDPLVFNHAHPDFEYSARMEILFELYKLIVIDDDDFRKIMTGQRTYVDPRLAALYDIPAPDMEGFGETWFEESTGRRGLLGKAGILAMNSHAASTSATHRGTLMLLFRKRMLPLQRSVSEFRFILRIQVVQGVMN